MGEDFTTISNLTEIRLKTRIGEGCHNRIFAARSKIRTVFITWRKKYMRKNFLLCLLGSALLVVAPAFAATKTKHHGNDFAYKAAQGGMAEVKFSELAQTNSQNQKVQDFAKRMITDHSAANDRLKDIATKDGIKIPDDIARWQQKEYSRLQNLNGEQFDRAYAARMVKDHEKAIALFQKEAQDGRVADVKQFASDTLPTIEEHFKMAKDLSNEVGAPTHRNKATHIENK